MRSLRGLRLAGHRRPLPDPARGPAARPSRHPGHLARRRARRPPARPPRHRRTRPRRLPRHRRRHHHWPRSPLARRLTRRQRIDALWHRVRPDPQRLQEAVENLRGSSRNARPVTAQVHVQGSVGELGLHPMRPMDGESGLSDSCGAVDCRDHHCIRREVGFPVDELVQGRQLISSAGELPDRQRQLTWHFAQRRSVGAPVLAIDIAIRHAASLPELRAASSFRPATPPAWSRVDRNGRAHGPTSRPVAVERELHRHSERNQA